jgi:hypothetical protein
MSAMPDGETSEGVSSVTAPTTATSSPPTSKVSYAGSAGSPVALETTLAPR